MRRLRPRWPASCAPAPGLRHLPVCRRRTPARRCCGRPARTAAEAANAGTAHSGYRHQQFFRHRCRVRGSSPPRPPSRTRPSTSSLLTGLPATVVTDDDTARAARSRCGTAFVDKTQTARRSANHPGLELFVSLVSAGCAPSPPCPRDPRAAPARYAAAPGQDAAGLVQRIAAYQSHGRGPPAHRA